jgi:GT2 family glycosyltransferase
MIHIRTPFSTEKNLGKAYNAAFWGVPDDDWVCLIDYDVMFLTPRSILIMYESIKEYPEAGIFTCLTNRIHHLAVDQLIFDKPSENTDIKFWQHQAEALESSNTEFVTEITHEISGFLMLISKRTWNEIKFWESGKCLGVDNDYSMRVLGSGRKIYRLNKLLVWHSYRLNNIRDKSHLQ